MSNESVTGRGRIRILGDKEKGYALQKLMVRYRAETNACFNPAAIPRTLVYALDAEQMTDKRKEPKRME